MICCFPCSTSHLPAVAQAMDTKEIQSSSIVDCRENEKLYPDPCRSIVETIDAANNVLLQEDEPEPQIPIMTDDEMDCLLNEISELLAKQSGSSGTPDTSDGDSNKSVEEMLMEAEKLVTLSLEHLNKSTVSISRIVPWQNVQGSDTVKKPTKTNHNSVKFSDVTETIPFQDCNLSPFKLRSKSDPDIAKTKLTDKKEIARRPNTSPSTSNVSGFKRIGGDQKDKDDIGKRTEKVYDLKLSDLAPVYEDKALEKKENELLLVHEHKFIPLDISPGDVGKEILNDGGQLNKTKLDTQNDNGVSAKKVDFLNNKVQANSDEFTGVIEDNNLNLKEQNQLMLFEEEVNSQLELIASYQRENERLCADIIKAKPVCSVVSRREEPHRYPPGVAGGRGPPLSLTGRGEQGIRVPQTRGGPDEPPPLAMPPSLALLLASLLAGAAASPLQARDSGDQPQEEPTTAEADPPTRLNTLEDEDFLGAQVIKVVNGRTPLLEQLIEKENMDVWSGNATHLDILIPKKKVDSVKKLLSENQISYSVMIDNLQTAINEQNPPLSEEEEELEGRKGHRMNWQKYQRLETIYGYLDYLAETYPGLVSVSVMGQTHENRPIKYIKISSGKRNANAVLIDGGMHAREWISPASATFIIKELVENRNSLPADLRDLDFYVVPVVNPDGYEYSHTSARMWRKNRAHGYACSGVDLNRNFNHHWGGKGTSANACSEIYRGTSPGSEPESRALMKLASSLNGRIKAYVTFHSYGQYILIPYGYDYNSLPANFAEMKAVGDQAAQAMRQSGGQAYTVGNTAHTLYPAAGGSDDWVKANTGTKYSYTIELRDTGGYGFTLPAREIVPTAREAFEAVKVISAAAARA